jgi:hypothetical protein
MRNMAVLGSVALLLAACGEPKIQERPETEGGAIRARMEAATNAYAECIDGQARAMELGKEPAGTLAINATNACTESRATLVEAVAAFNQFGYPSRTPEQVKAVAEASVKILEDEARRAAVVTIVKRQNEMNGTNTPVPEEEG